MNRPRTLAIVITAAVAIAIVVLLLLCRLVFDPATLRQPPRPTTELVEVDEEFVELLDQSTVHSDPAPAYSATTPMRPTQRALTSRTPALWPLPCLT